MSELKQTCPDFLIDAAIDLMAEHGYVAMSMRKLASHIGILPGSLYHHVSSKQDILLDVVLAVVDRRLHAWCKYPCKRDLAGYINFLMARQRSHPKEEVLLRHEVRHLEPSAKTWGLQAMQKLRIPLQTIIENGRRAGEYRVADPSVATEAVLALLDAGNVLRHLHHRGERLEEELLHMVDAMLGGNLSHSISLKQPLLAAS
jgi:AcrR family transcriptional regulator